MTSWPDKYRFALRGAIAILWLAASQGVPPSVSAQPSDAEPVVKMSRGGICHERGTVHYQQTIYFQPFESMEACLAAGGRRMGGEEANDPPQFEYRGTHPPRDYWPYVIVGVIVAVVAFAGAILPLWRRWKVRRSQRAFADRERRRWEGHRLGSKKPPQR